MNNSSPKQIVFIVYDGIHNSVFQSMVLAPLMEMLMADVNTSVTLISFERKKLTAQTLQSIIPTHNRLNVVIMRKLPFLGKLSLWLGVHQLQLFLKKVKADQIIARGPLAGWVAIKATQTLTAASSMIPSTIIQARGLCAEEYRYTHQKHVDGYLKHFYRQRCYHALKQIECQAYSNQNMAIQSVSPALKEYMVKHFHANPDAITIVTNDLPQPIAPEQVAEWRSALRKQLGIMNDAYVYCYSGSYKPWQCVDQTIHFFANLHEHEDKNFLLILTQDTQQFTAALEYCKVPKNRWLVLSVTPNELAQYLAVANAGLLFREPDVINWVSRPTKMLEYQMVGLKIIHNNSIGWLCSNDSNELKSNSVAQHQ